MQKLDPYLNVDPGTMNPFQHGEVFVTEDGAETDLDVGHYERFLDVNLVGAVAGVWLLTTLAPDTRLIALAIVAGLTIYGELRSISAAIESVPPLRWLDSLGRA